MMHLSIKIKSVASFELQSDLPLDFVYYFPENKFRNKNPLYQEGRRKVVLPPCGVRIRAPQGREDLKLVFEDGGQVTTFSGAHVAGGVGTVWTTRL